MSESVRNNMDNENNINNINAKPKKKKRLKGPHRFLMENSQQINKDYSDDNRPYGLRRSKRVRNKKSKSISISDNNNNTSNDNNNDFRPKQSKRSTSNDNDDKICVKKPIRLRNKVRKRSNKNRNNRANKIEKSNSNNNINCKDALKIESCNSDYSNNINLFEINEAMKLNMLSFLAKPINDVKTTTICNIINKVRDTHPNLTLQSIVNVLANLTEYTEQMNTLYQQYYEHSLKDSSLQININGKKRKNSELFLPNLNIELQELTKQQKPTKPVKKKRKIG
mmetsp:Transcript_11034/g.13768  ORF Transcript_11034/g.13768 Transcript_11034/m.13768 type:complete len:281 (-) Transcript_11034:50-892(-)